VLLRFDNGTIGSLVVSQVTAGRKNCLRFEISGSECSLAWNSETANQLRVGKRDASNEVLIRDPALMSAAAGAASDYPGGHNEGYADTFKQCFKALYAAIDSGDLSNPVYPTFLDGHREVSLCEAILQSHRQRKWIDVRAND
jgi:predicted dehydrogenase